MGEFTLKACVG